jgi:Fe-S-cluster-containing dehydrogenase component/DMSO reductase anchor subunit
MKTPVRLGPDLVASATAVDSFTEWHTQAGHDSGVLLYRGLVPLSAPAPGEQYAFEVDLDRCTGCKACVVACHSMNGLLEEESWRDVGTLTGEAGSEPWLQTVTSACHHCAEPGCLEGCPVGAYEKDVATGIVRHLDDQCIGCRYCELKCPYGVPKYSEALGIVRKCDLCAGRLAVGQAPACVNACPNEAIRVRIVDVGEVISAAAPGVRMLSGTFPSEYTKPATRYVTAKTVPQEVRSSGESVPTRQPAHWPLVLMLQLSQMAFGLWVVGGVVLATGALALERAAFLSATVFLHVGLGASVFHLGKPLGAWRFFVGLRTSWMSREILAFGTVSAASMLSLALPEVWPGWVLWSKALKYSTVSGSVVAVWTSVMIYADTRRPGWERWRVALGFLGGGLLLGISGVGLLALLRGENMFGERLGMAAVVWRGALLAAEEWDLRRCRARGGELATVVAFRTAVTPAARWVLLGLNVGCSVLGVFGLLAGEGMVSLTCATVSFAGTLVAELLRRWLFFVGTPAPQMPRSVSGESR